MKMTRLRRVALSTLIAVTVLLFRPRRAGDDDSAPKSS
jgi:hypothetical protein